MLCLLGAVCWRCAVMSDVLQMSSFCRGKDNFLLAEGHTVTQES